MATVTVTDGIKYGFGMMAYLLAVFLVGGALVFVGSLMTGGGVMMMGQGPGGGAGGGGLLGIVGALITLVGVLSIYAGMLGIGYKMIADGVAEGVEEAM